MRTLNAPSMLVGFGIALLAFLAVSGVAPTEDSWPPPKRAIVNVFQQATPSGVTIPPGGTFSVYSVPSDRWLTVTATSAATGSPCFWAEDLGGVLSLKGTVAGSSIGTPVETAAGAGGPLGWTFRPGSNVVVQNAHPTASQGMNGYSLIGYLSNN